MWNLLDISNSRILRVLFLLCCEKEIEKLYSLFLLIHSDLQCKPYLNAISISKPQNPYLTDNFYIQVTKDDLFNSHKDDYGTKYSSDNKRLLLGGYARLHEDTISKDTEIICNDAFFKGDDNFLSWEDKVVIPEGVKIIGRNPFAGHLFPIISLSDYFVAENGALYANDKQRLVGLYLNTTHFNIPEGVTHIDDNAFRGHIKLSSISFPSTLKRIGNSAFQDTGLVSVAFPDSLTEIGNSAFEYCHGLKEIRMSSNISYIGNRAFRRTKVGYIKIPKNTYYIGVGSFEGIDRIKILLVSNIYETDGLALFSKDKKLLLFYYSDKEEYSIPEGVTHICSYAFADKYMRSVLIPQSVVYIDEDAFNPNMIKTIYVTKDIKTRIKSLLPIYVHRVVKEKYE